MLKLKLKLNYCIRNIIKCLINHRSCVDGWLCFLLIGPLLLCLNPSVSHTFFSRLGRLKMQPQREVRTTISPSTLNLSHISILKKYICSYYIYYRMGLRYADIAFSYHSIYWREFQVDSFQLYYSIESRFDPNQILKIDWWWSKQYCPFSITNTLSCSTIRNVFVIFSSPPFMYLHIPPFRINGRRRGIVLHREQFFHSARRYFQVVFSS